ncbi:hypothetical protein [Streptomyces sp. B27]|uniref:hypothetical protein n=1 Tax=Streptomyces TaxID=1883 RepID=UPI0013E3DD38|nr:hypothetical protein [Streptomyces sp. B27]
MLDEVGDVLLSALRDWTREGGARTGAADAREWGAPGGDGPVQWARVETVEAVRFSLT